MKVGETRSIHQTSAAAATLRQFQWQPTPAGGQVGAISFASEGASGVRLGVLIGQLPGGAMLRVYSQSQPNEVFQISGQEVLQRIDANLRSGDTSEDGRTWWTPYLGFADATLEIELPAGVPVSGVDIAVPRLSHIYVNLETLAANDALAQKVGESESCELDANCYADLAATRDAVARMLFSKSGGSYICTGTLLNDQSATGTPYFISANHCIASQTVASTLQTRWFYRSASCGSLSVLATNTWRYNGATLLYASGITDVSFMRLNETPPSGAVFAGWSNVAPSQGASTSALHHPSGDLLKYSKGSVTEFLNCTVSGGVSCSTASSSSSSHYKVTWSQGVTEGGSSGSGIFSNGNLVGVLSGGASSCTASASRMYDFYGRFDVAYKAALSQWLSASSATTRTSIYRFYNTATGAHFFTSNAVERDSVIANLKSFNYEGIGFYAYGAQAVGTSPVFRFYNPRTAAHFFTISADERDWVMRTYPFFQYEGPAWYAQTDASNGATAMYRFYLPKTGTHFYTFSAAERDYVIAQLKEYQYEGTGYYAWTAR